MQCRIAPIGSTSLPSPPNLTSVLPFLPQAFALEAAAPTFDEIAARATPEPEPEQTVEAVDDLGPEPVTSRYTSVLDDLPPLLRGDAGGARASGQRKVWWK